MSSHSALAVVWQQLPVVDVPLPLGSRTVCGLTYQLLISHNCISQLIELVLLYSPDTDHTENVSSIIVCFFIAGETACPQSCSLGMAVVLSPVTWHWVSLSHCALLKLIRPEQPIGVSPFRLSMGREYVGVASASTAPAHKLLVVSSYVWVGADSFTMSSHSFLESWQKIWLLA
jgi:hypothetical protein